MKQPWKQRLGFWWIAENHPNLPAVVASPSGVEHTFADLADRAHQLVHALRRRAARRRPPDDPSGRLLARRAHHVLVGHDGEAQGDPASLPLGVGPSEFADQAKIFGRAFHFLPLEGVHLVSAGMHHGGCQSFDLAALNVGQGLAIIGKRLPTTRPEPRYSARRAARRRCRSVRTLALDEREAAAELGLMREDSRP